MSAADDPPPPYQVNDPAPRVAQVAQAQETQPRFYHVYHDTSSNYKVLLDDKTRSYYINSRTVRTPDLIIHRGSGNFDRVIANCKFPELVNQFTMNVYREENDNTRVVQTKMTLDGRFTTAVNTFDTTGAAITVQRPLVWKKIPNLTLMDEETGEIAAVMHGMTFGLQKCFVIEVRASYGNAFERLMITSAMTLYEYQKRASSTPSSTGHSSRSRRRAAGAAQMGFIGGSMGAGAGGF